ncbi:MAG TPA: ABC transporter substrate-binding protein [Candidatus Binatia bacterium]
MNRNPTCFFSALAAGLAAAWMFAVAFKAEGGPLPVTYAAISGSHSAVWVAQEAGLFDKHGLPVELIYLGGGMATKVLLAGTSPIISISGPAPIAAAVGGGDPVFVSCVLNTFIFSIMSRPEIEKPEGLRGKKVGVSRFGAATDFALRYTLKQWGIEAGRDLTILQIGGVPEILGAMQAGSIDAGVLSSPSTLRAKQAGMRELVDMGKLGIEYPGSCVVTTKKFLRENRPTVKSFLKAFTEGTHKILTDKAFASKVISKYTRVNDPEVVEVTYLDFVRYIQSMPSPTAGGVKLVLDQISATDPKAAGIKPESLIDTSILRELEAEGILPLKRN